MSGSIFSAEQRLDWDRNGYVMGRKLFDDEEIAFCAVPSKATPHCAPACTTGTTPRARPPHGLVEPSRRQRLRPGARSRRVVDTMEELLGGEVYHYHSKFTAKEPLDGGAWEWHQDYGYWYHNGIVYPYMASVMVALDRATRENGCLQVVKGSHHVGRLEHGVLPGKQVGADPRRVEEILKRLTVEHVEMEPGDGLFFHANVLHRSDQNRSTQRRWTVLHC